VTSEQGREVGAQVPVGEAGGEQAEDEGRGEQRVDAAVGEPHPGDAPAVGGDDRTITDRHDSLLGKAHYRTPHGQPLNGRCIVRFNGRSHISST
jgi:hypothetical protein